MSAGEYTVRLAGFEGPMDLLLQLIRRAELDITEIALAQVTDQYLSHLSGIEEVDVDAAGEFLVVAATLIEVKSRLVNPEVGESGVGQRGAMEGELGDPAAELLGQLLRYKAYREAGMKLEVRRALWEKRFGAGRAHADRGALREAVGGDDALDMEDLGLYDLVRAFERIVRTVEFGRLGTHAVESDETPIELHAADVVDRLERFGAMEGGGAGEGVGLGVLFEGRRKAEVVGLFLAVLELVRQRRVRVVVVDGGQGDAGEAVRLVLTGVVEGEMEDEEGEVAGEVGEGAGDGGGVEGSEAGGGGGVGG